jgi:hypothetical protein
VPLGRLRIVERLEEAGAVHGILCDPVDLFGIDVDAVDSCPAGLGEVAFE